MNRFKSETLLLLQSLMLRVTVFSFLNLFLDKLRPALFLPQRSLILRVKTNVSAAKSATCFWCSPTWGDAGHAAACFVSEVFKQKEV